jgi:DNA-binding NarL/FixJ family response regulator
MPVAEGATARDARAAVEAGDPDVLLIDVEVPGDGMAAADKVLRTRPDVKVVVLTACDAEEHVSHALRMGVHGYILKDVSGPELVSAIEAVHRGEPYITPALASRLLMQTRGRALAISGERCIDLTARDRQLLGFLATGLTNQEIALSLGMNVRTVKHCLTQMFRKMRVRNRLEAILEAQRLRVELDAHMPPSAQLSMRR